MGRSHIGLALYPWLLSMTLAANLHAPSPAADQEARGAGAGFGAGGRLREVYAWRQLDFAFPSPGARQAAIASGAFDPANALPLGIEVWEGRLFVSMPRWRSGVPATLATVPRDPRGSVPSSAALKPFPNWAWHLQPNCDGLTSVFRMAVDPCGRLWVMDSGAVDVVSSLKQKCPPQILVFDLRTDSLLWRYMIPEAQTKPGGLFTNIVVDVRGGRCEDAFAYVSDVFRYGLVVYSWREDRSWRVEHSFFYPDPLACTYELHGLTFRWTDGLFGLALSPDRGPDADRTLYFHPMSSFREFAVPASVLRNETAARDRPEAFQALAEPRAPARGHASASAMDRRGVLFYNLVTQDAVGCWNSEQPAGFRTDLQGVVARDNATLVFPNDLKVDHERRQSVWVLTNRLHDYLYRKLDPRDVNFRILTAPTDTAARGTVCDPEYRYVPSSSRAPLGCAPAF